MEEDSKLDPGGGRHAGLSGSQRRIARAISRAKSKVWDELLESLDRDPWGRPYRMVRERLRRRRTPLTETLEVEFLDDVVNTLFPPDDHPSVE